MSIRRQFLALVLLVPLGCHAPPPPTPAPLELTELTERVEHGNVINGDVRLHYVTLGEGPLVVLLHGFPEYWYSWRHQIDALAAEHRVVALDLRGYNRSDAPEGIAAYAMPTLMSDVDAVLAHFEAERATIIGHDWGAALAWAYAMYRPARVERLVALSVPHPAGFGRALATDSAQHESSQYARDFQREDAHEALSPEILFGFLSADAPRESYLAALERSDIEAMLAYYKANYPKTAAPTEGAAPPPAPSLPHVQAPTLVIHGLDDQALHAAGHNQCWEWIDAPTTLVMIPGVGHWVQQDAHELVTRTLVDWLRSTPAGVGSR